MLLSDVQGIHENGSSKSHVTLRLADEQAPSRQADQGSGSGIVLNVPGRTPAAVDLSTHQCDPVQAGSSFEISSYEASS